MRDEDKPFVCYKQGWSMKIVPRNAAGWRALGLWMAALGLLVAIFLATLPAVQGQPAEIALIAGFVAITVVWGLAMIRWMLARSEIVDLKKLLDLKREQDRKRR